VLNKRRIEQIVNAATRDDALVTGTQSVTIFFDHAEYGIGPDDQPYEKSDAHEGNYLQVICFCPLCGCRIGQSALDAHMERRCHRRKTKTEPSHTPYTSPVTDSESCEVFRTIAPDFARSVGRMPPRAEFEGATGPCRVWFLSADNPDSIRVAWKK